MPGTEPPEPPARGGGDDGRSGDVPNYGARLRRARLGLICAVVTVSMVFISLTSAYIVRQGLPTFDGCLEQLCARLGRCAFAVVAAGDQYGVLLAKQRDHGSCAPEHRRQAALAPVQSIPGISLGEERRFPVAGNHGAAGFGFLVGQWLAWGELHNRGFYFRRIRAVLLLPAHGNARGSPCGRNHCVVVGRDHFPAAQADRGAADRGRHYRMVLALHVGAVDLCVCVVGIVR